MPCHDPEPYIPPDPRIRERLDIITRLACDYCKICEGRDLPVPDYAAGWWAEHKAFDAREKAEAKVSEERNAIRAKAREKLTPEEREALGI